ncbi:hypothetical protein RDI58_029211 [Solanum bulbocastanum]|uniref:DUF4283 domain-containing protein n=1 Tax=Solanum bulbocastanum TaxID=147425 RepID=A0AAN8SWC3_SOLBU
MAMEENNASSLKDEFQLWKAPGNDTSEQIPIWVKFPSLPVGYWSVQALSKVASAIGIPLYTNGFTTNAEKISYARVLIEVDISKN